MNSQFGLKPANGLQHFLSSNQGHSSIQVFSLAQPLKHMDKKRLISNKCFKRFMLITIQRRLVIERKRKIKERKNVRNSYCQALVDSQH